MSEAIQDKLKSAESEYVDYRHEIVYTLGVNNALETNLPVLEKVTIEAIESD
jgi:hypothetical protein